MSASLVSLIPPGTGGVRDYATVLGEPLGSPVVELSPDTDVSTLGGECALLHFSGYGFEKRGVPFWLVKKVRLLHGRFDRIGIVFHELFATNVSPWGSAFWLAGLQQRIARDLLLEADFWLASREDSARWLQRQSKPLPHRVLPVFSNVGELDDIEGPRSPWMVVFGSPGMRRQVYEWNDGEIFRHAEQLGLEIHDLGPSIDDETLSRKLVRSKVVLRGKLPKEEVSAVLAAANYGAVAYPADFAAKSGIFAAYCSHGVCPVLLSKDYGVHDGLRPNVHYAGGFDALQASFIEPRVVGRAARKWYASHDVQTQVRALRELTASVPRQELAR
ncbi:conserved hypothetical protein [Burkholderiales bacterium 8X]|nr:conserved hypothetical protein [Burkholderiales bacterium 8X]